MSRYIDADKLIIKMDRWYEEMCLKYGETDQFNMGYAEGINAIENAQTADVVEVVRCKDCKWCLVENWDGEILYGCDCGAGMNDISPDDFCSYGERKDK